jgi:hypothetical protein
VAGVQGNGGIEMGDLNEWIIAQTIGIIEQIEIIGVV